MGRLRIPLVLLMLALAAAPVAAREGPALSVPTATLRTALSCPERLRASRPPVLLVHGTATNASDTWSWNYEKTLPVMGFDVCTVDLPDRALGDIQVASEYVVHAIRAGRSRRPETPRSTATPSSPWRVTPPCARSRRWRPTPVVPSC